MAQVHDLLTIRGKQAALEGGHPRSVVEAAAAYMSNEECGVGFLYSGWCQTALPHKRLADDEPWIVQQDRMSLMVEPGRRIVGPKTAVPVGVPYGSRARLILIYLQSEALRTSSAEVELGRSLRHWFGKMGIPSAGKNNTAVRDQAERIGRCRLTFQFTAGKRSGFVNQTIVETGMFDDGDPECRNFLDVVRLSDGFFRELCKHPVPIEDAALKALSNNSQALDIYCWLAYRLHALTGPTPLSWAAVKGQFGQNVAHTGGFRAKFRANLALALAVYPAAKVELADTGLVLHRSRPPVAPKQFQIAVA